MKATKQERQDALDRLRDLLPEGSTVHVVYRERTSNGTTYLDFYLFQPGLSGGAVKLNKFWLSYNVALALGLRFDDKRQCVRMPFLNMDPGFHVVDSLSRNLYGKSYALSKEDV